MSNKTIEQKLRNLQINLAQDRSPSELAQSGIYFRPTSPSTPQQNIFSNYIDSVHRALDSSKQTPTNKINSNDLYYPSPYENPYIQYDYQRQPAFQINFNSIRPPVPPRQSSLCFLIKGEKADLGFSDSKIRKRFFWIFWDFKSPEIPRNLRKSKKISFGF